LLTTAIRLLTLSAPPADRRLGCAQPVPDLLRGDALLYSQVDPDLVVLVSLYGDLVAQLDVA
jgi:hypothetical protein